MRRLIALLSLVVLAACTSGPPPRGTAPEIAALASEIRTLSPQVDPAEARRAATIAYDQTHSLALAYQITDSPLVHNAKVNAGTKPRGLCYHWAEDMERRLNAEEFRTLDLKRAIANSETRFLIEHSTAVITAKGTSMEAGIVLDPWRNGGRLFWSRVATDKRYDWLPREEVLRRRGQIRYAQRPDGSRAAPPAN
ncbi:hypothetical protein [Sulfitobacter sp. JB4-11]|uniref:hypothetical protein n=1 Tax=Sulfitobacter rhodophyticola TaxID=3238304 RepID=UPI003D819097